jgi:hypothetical protein
MDLLPEDETRTEVALMSLWEVYRSPLWIAAMELRTAARTDPELKRAYARTHASLIAPTFVEFFVALLGPGAREDAALVELLEMSVVFVNGLAVARENWDDAWCDRQIRLFARMITPIIEEGRSRCRTQAATH